MSALIRHDGVQYTTQHIFTPIWSVPCVDQSKTQSAYLGTLVRIGCRDESALLFSSQVFSFSIDSEQLAKCSLTAVRRNSHHLVNSFI